MKTIKLINNKTIVIMNTKLKFFILIAVFSMGISASAQTDSTKQNQQYAKTLFDGNKKLTHGGYGALSLKYKQIDNSSTLMLGSRGAWSVNHIFAIGISGYGIISNPQKMPKANLNTYYTGGYGGLYLEAILFSKNLINVSIPVEFGGGGIVKIEGNENEYKANGYTSFVYIEPGLEVNLNVSRGFKISLGAYYALNSKIGTSEKLNADLMNGLSVGLQFKWGLF